jgi:hypothetical protein
MHDYRNYKYHYGWHAGVGLLIIRLFSILIFALVFGYAVELLWNWLGPVIFGLKQIGYWEGVGLVIISRILFGSFTATPHHSIGEGRRIRMRMLKHLKNAGDEFWDTKGGWSKWKYYNEFWKDEGKEAFQKYVERHAHENGPGEKNDTGA